MRLNLASSNSCICEGIWEDALLLKSLARHVFVLSSVEYRLLKNLLLLVLQKHLLQSDLLVLRGALELLLLHSEALLPSLVGIESLVDQLQLARVESARAPQLLNQLRLAQAQVGQLTWRLICRVRRCLWPKLSQCRQVLIVGAAQSILKRVVALHVLDSSRR